MTLHRQEVLLIAGAVVFTCWVGLVLVTSRDFPKEERGSYLRQAAVAVALGSAVLFGAGWFL